MKSISTYNTGDVISIYADYERNQNYIGTARLKDYFKSGRTFILEESYNEIDQIVYSYEYWHVD